jgi:AraC-like DNA-binding protein
MGGMARRFRLSRLLISRLEELGLAPDAVVRRAGIPTALLREDRMLVSTEQFFAFWSAVEEFSGDPLIGLALGSEQRVERYDPIALAALSASSFGDAVDRAARYKLLTCPEEIRLVRRESECALQFHWLLAAQTTPRVLTDLCFAWLLTLGSRGTGRRIVPRQVAFTQPPAFRQEYEEFFGCPVTFDATIDEIVVAARELDQPFQTRNGELLSMLAPQLEAELAAQLAAGQPDAEVKAIVKRLLTGRRPELREVARAMGASVRTLQRRLSEHGVTYQHVLEDARRELAHHYLLHSALDLSETAYLLGYEDASSFFRAFHQWEGTTPGRWRDLQRTAAAASDKRQLANARPGSTLVPA